MRQSASATSPLDKIYSISWSADGTEVSAQLANSCRRSGPPTTTNEPDPEAAGLAGKGEHADDFPLRECGEGPSGFVRSRNPRCARHDRQTHADLYRRTPARRRRRHRILGPG